LWVKKELVCGFEPGHKAGDEKPNSTQANAGKVLASAAALRLIPAHLVPKLARDTGVNHSSRKAVLETHHRVRHVALLDQDC
jgi:hypothetical protein